jgi:ATP-dependent Clp protease ATP-binding subunit ClpC
MVSFKNTILIMTSNVGTRQLKEFGKGIGFNNQVKELNEDYSKNLIQKALSKTFAPEFLNRIDDIIFFDQLSKESLMSIIELELDSFRQRVESFGYLLEVTPESKALIASKGYDVQYGARPLKRLSRNTWKTSWPN